jgi:nucleotide-binding universal stress UspA family protein
MSLKSILVHIDDVEVSRPRLDAAIRVARDFQAELVGLYLVPPIELNSTVAAMVPPDVIERRQRETAQAQRDAERAFRNTTAAAGLAAVDWRAPPVGSPVDIAIEHARCSDLLVVRQPSSPGYLLAESLVSTVLMALGRPLLIVPYIGARPTLGDNVLVAWDGGREAARALADALPFLERARRVTVISVAPEGTVDGDAWPAEARLGAWLRAHGIKADLARYAVSDVPIGAWLLSRAADIGSDLIVMGGYGHPRMRQLILGGVTRTMLESVTVPVLMSH